MTILALLNSIDATDHLFYFEFMYIEDVEQNFFRKYYLEKEKMFSNLRLEARMVCRSPLHPLKNGYFQNLSMIECA